MGRIKLGISLKSLGQPFRRSLPLAQKLGAAAIELEATGELAPKNLTQTGRREITHLLRSHDLTVSALACPLRRGLDVAENLEPRLEQIRDAMALSFELGARLVILPVGKIPVSQPAPAEPPAARQEEPLIIAPSTASHLSKAEKSENLMKESLDALGRHGDRTGVIVALESGLDDPAALVAYLERFDAGSLGVNYNPANLVLNGFSAYEAIRTFAKRLVHAHGQDARRINPSKWGTVPVGHGDLDWMQLLAHFAEIDYRGHLTVLADDQAELAAGIAFLRRFIA